MEYGILVIKPDGMNQYVKQLLEEELHAFDLSVVESYSERITQHQARKIFSTNAFDEEKYYSYLSGGSIQISLIKGDYAISKLRDIKYKIRKKFLCEKSMKNILHTSDTGNEYRIQLERLFPNLKYQDYRLYADLHVPLKMYMLQKNNTYWKEQDAIVIEQGELNSNLQNFNYFKKGLIGIKTECVFKGKTIPIISYLKEQEDWYKKAQQLIMSDVVIDKFMETVMEVESICIVDYLPFEFYEHSSVSELQQCGVRGFKIFDWRYSMQQIERIRYFVQYKYKMLITGGSNSLDEKLLTIDQELYEKMVSKLKDGYN